MIHYILKNGTTNEWLIRNNSIQKIMNDKVRKEIKNDCQPKFYKSAEYLVVMMVHNSNRTKTMGMCTLDEWIVMYLCIDIYTYMYYHTKKLRNKEFYTQQKFPPSIASISPFKGILMIISQAARKWHQTIIRIRRKKWRALEMIDMWLNIK